MLVDRSSRGLRIDEAESRVGIGVHALLLERRLGDREQGGVVPQSSEIDDGIEPFIASLDEKLDLTGHALERLRRLPGMQILAAPQLSVIAFCPAARRRAWSLSGIDAGNDSNGG